MVLLNDNGPWWQVRNAAGIVGFVPSNYVQKKAPMPAITAPTVKTPPLAEKLQFDGPLSAHDGSASGYGGGGSAIGAVGSGKKPRVGGAEKFSAPAIRLGRATQAAAGLADLMGYNEMTIVQLIMQNGGGIDAIVCEIEANGTAEDKKNVHSLIDGMFVWLTPIQCQYF